jgi:tyrosinase
MLTHLVDPLWFLHHSQLDRLWWIWQRGDHGRVLEYRGKSNNDTDTAASLSDTMNYGGFVPTMRVGQVMGTESETLCYRYE